MSDDQAFDLFLSYSRTDIVEARRLAQALRAFGFRIFFDRDYLVAGQSWIYLLERYLRSCRAIVICLGPEGLSPWQQREQYVALDRQAQESAFPVIPVLLPEARDPPLGFLRLQTWIDLKAGVEDARALDVLAKAIRGQPPMDAATPDPRATICPYRGLEPFREEDATFFVGREAFVQTMVAKVERMQILGVVGASGSGKSSVVLAGLVPALRRRANGRVWEIGVMRPGQHPLRQLAAAFLPPEPEQDEYNRIEVLKGRAAQLAAGAVTLLDVVSRVLEKQPGTDRLLLVVDQWEELYTQTTDEQERAAFLRVLLGGLGAAAPFTLVLTLRGDFYGRALEDRTLADRLQDSVVNIGPMRREELERAIVAPAVQVGQAFEKGLVDDILDDIGNEPGSLPLLEFLLKELWDKRERDGRLSFVAYQATGGVKRAIAARAEAELARLTPDQKEAARRFLIRLITPGEGRNEDTRARALIPIGDEAVRAVIKRFADARLLTTSRDPVSGDELVEVSHEALIREWSTFRDWVDADRDFLRKVERVKAAMRYWIERDRPPDLLLTSGRALEEARELLKHRNAESVRSIAKAAGVAYETARSHLRSL